MAILIVDDDPESRWLLEHLMVSEGYEVRSADYAEGALLFFRAVEIPI